MLDGHARKPIENALEPIGNGLHRIGVTADMVTALGVVMAGAAAVAIGSGRFLLAFVLLALTGVPDALDGAVAKAAGTTSVRGAFFDSVADRLSDALLFGGCAWYLSADGSRMGMLPFAILGAASLVSYQRAKAESLGFDAKGGLMERAERFFVLGIGLVFSSLFVPILWLMLGLTSLTAIQRFVKVWKQADRPPTPTATPPRRRPRSTSRRRSSSRRHKTSGSTR